MVVTALDKSGVTVPDADFTITSPSAYSVVIQLIYVCLIGPIIEELIYRGLVLKLISPYGKGLAVFCSALFFALMHGNVPQAASAFAGGFIYAMVAVRYNSIVPTIIIHILNNICASIVDVGDVFGWTRAYEVYLASQILILFIGIYLTFTALRPLIWQIKSAEPPCALTLKQRYTAVFSNIFIICYLLYLIWGFIASFIVYNF
jgi:hypothetical protein